MTFVKVGQLGDACPGGRCPGSARNLHASMVTSATVADVALPIGAALVGAGLVGVVVTRPSDSKLSVSLAPRGVVVEGRFW
ncbi:MAG: hypothetical protein FJ095_04815 [Deltaproteobacteria bacterium]|nr:hypothetical protein [Deltaproteobacteria bacterium]